MAIFIYGMLALGLLFVLIVSIIKLTLDWRNK